MAVALRFEDGKTLRVFLRHFVDDECGSGDHDEQDVHDEYEKVVLIFASGVGHEGFLSLQTVQCTYKSHNINKKAVRKVQLAVDEHADCSRQARECSKVLAGGCGHQGM